jgi:class 3 adenylate cyclase/tetratricopeptide (TPR) repeat protein
LQRQHAAVLAADVVGYTRLIEAAEEETHRQLMRLRREVIDPHIAAHQGRVVKNTGDGFIAVFDTANQAADCAVTLQRTIGRATIGQPPGLRIAFRMGINVADIIAEKDDVYGEGVNVAARLQTYAEPGDVIVSQAVAENLAPQARQRAMDLGELPLRNMQKPVRVYALRPDPTAGAPQRLGEAAAGEEGRPSIALLPFRANRRDADSDTVALGVVDAIVHALSGLKELFVVSRGSTLAFGSAPTDPVAVGRQLGVRYIMRGGVLRAASRLRINTELLDTQAGTVAYAENHEGVIEQLFELMDRIALRLVKIIAPNVRERELRRALRKPPSSLTAYDLLLEALDLLYRMDADSFRKARGLLQQAIALDPGYAPPYTYAALWHVFRVGEIGSPDPDADGMAAADRAAAAIDRDGNDALALAIYGHVQAYLLHDTATAVRFLDRAIDAGPSVAMAWTMSSATRGFMGDGALAVAHGERGQRLAPADPYTFWHEGILAQAHYVNGDYDQAITWARSAVAQNRSIRFTLRTLTASLAAQGRQAEAEAAARHLLSVQPDFRLSVYAPRCPFVEPVLGRWIGRLRQAGLPD